MVGPPRIFAAVVMACVVCLPASPTPLPRSCNSLFEGAGVLPDTRDELGDYCVQECTTIKFEASSDVRLAPMVLRCQQLLHRLKRERGSAAGTKWRDDFVRGVSRLTWGMPGCPVERKVAAGGGAMSCNNIKQALETFEDRPLLMHVVKDAMDWQHFDTRECP
jgi:hypothetical protein